MLLFKIPKKKGLLYGKSFFLCFFAFQLTEKMIQRKVYSNITTDQFGFFSISKLSTDFPKGFNIISATGKNAAVGSDGTNVLPVFSISKNEVQCNYGYLYKMSGNDPVPLANATNVTVLVFVVG